MLYKEELQFRHICEKKTTCKIKMFFQQAKKQRYTSAIRKKLTNPDLVTRRLVLASRATARAIMAGQRALPVILGGPQGVPKPSTRVDLLSHMYN